MKKIQLTSEEKEIMDAMTDQITPIVVFKKPTRVGYTKMLGITAAYWEFGSCLGPNTLKYRNDAVWRP